MRYLSSIILLSLLHLSSSHPAPSASTSLEPRCGTFLAPDAYYMLDETHPDSVVPINNLFSVMQDKGANGQIGSRHYTLVHFPPTPSGSYGCELLWNLPAGMSFNALYGTNQCEVKQVTGYSQPLQPTWNNIVNSAVYSQSGVAGTFNAVSGQGCVVNTAPQCSSSAPVGMVGGGYGLAYVFKFAAWTEQGDIAGGLSFTPGSAGGVTTGPYLNFNC